MFKLSEKHKRFLNMLATDEASRRYSFQKLKGIKWFDHLVERGFLNPNQNPAPIESEDNLYTVPTWDVLNYLLNTLQHDDEISLRYKFKYLNFIEEVTKKTQPENSNYRTWWMFAQMLPFLADEVTPKFISENIPVWLDDRFTTSITVKELSEKLFPKLIELSKTEAALELLIAIIRVEKKEQSTELDKFDFKADHYWVKDFLIKQPKIIANLGNEVLEVLEEELKIILSDDDRKQDKTAFIWRPAIEDHEQNPDYQTKAKTVLVTAMRDVLFELESSGKLSEGYLNRYFTSEFVVLKRLGIHHINATWPKHRSQLTNLLNEKYLNSYFIHEFHGLIKNRFDEFDQDVQDAFLDFVDSLEKFSDVKYKKEQIAHNKLEWLTAVKDSENSRAKKLYEENLAILGKEPEHPDFPFYSKSGFVPDRSKYSVEDLASLQVDELVKTLNEFEEDRRQFEGPTERGLANTFRSYLNTLSKDQKPEIDKFIELKDIYLSEVIQYLEKKVNDGGRQELNSTLRYCEKIIKERSDLFNENFSSTLDSMNRFIREITRKDDLFSENEDLAKIEEILKLQLSKISENRSGIESTNDWLTKAINTLKGNVLEALINYSLLKCRLADKKQDNHKVEWKELKPLYDKLLNENYDYVTASILSRYIPNLIYLDKEWIASNLQKLFNYKNKEEWLAAVSGHTYGKYVDSVMDFIVANGQLKLILKAYDEGKIEFQAYRRFIQFSAIHYLAHDDSGAMNDILKRSKDAELAELVDLVRYLRENIHQKYIPRVFDLWALLLKHIGERKEEYINTLSGLSKWSVFIDKLDEKEYQLLENVMPFAFAPKHFDTFMDEWIHLVKLDPEKTGELFLIALEKKIPYLQKEKVIEFVNHLWEAKLKEQAEKISTIFFENGIHFVTEYLNDLKGEQSSV